MFNAFKQKPSGNRLPDGRYLAIEWSGIGGMAVEVSLKSGRVTPDNVFGWTWPVNVDPSCSAGVAGEWLRQQLDHRNVRASNVIVAVPGRHAFLRLLQLPNVEPTELQQLIALQAESLQGAQDGELCYDYQQLPTNDNAAETEISLSGVEPDVFAASLEMCQAAGLTVKACGVGAFELKSLLPVAAEGATLNLLLEGGVAHLVLHNDDVPVRAINFAAGTPAETAQRTSGAAARLLASVETLPDRPDRICLFGEAQTEVQTELKNVFPKSDVQIVSTNCDQAVQAIALASSLSRPAATFEFITPSHRRNTGTSRWQKGARLAGGATLLAGLLLFWNYDEQQRLESELATLDNAAEAKQELNERGQAVVNRWQYVSHWQDSATNWSDQIRDLKEHLPHEGIGFLTRMQFEQTTSDDPPLLRLDGNVKSPHIAMNLNRELLDSGRYTLRPHGIEPAPRDMDFPSSYRIEATVNPSK